MLTVWVIGLRNGNQRPKERGLEVGGYLRADVQGAMLCLHSRGQTHTHTHSQKGQGENEEGRRGAV